LAVAGSAAFMLGSTPAAPQHLAFHSDSWSMTLRAAVKFCVGWLGAPVLQTAWPWVLFVLAVPVLYLLVRLLADLRRLRFAGLLRWWDLSALLLSALAVAVAMGYGRARYHGIWASRYCVLETPIAVAVYFMLVRSGAPRALMACLAIGMAVCVAWDWPSNLDRAASLRPQQQLLIASMRRGHEPLSVLAERYHDATGIPADMVQFLVEQWPPMRQAGISVFHKVHGTDADPARRCLFWRPEAGRLVDSLHAVDDAAAVGGRAVEADATEAPAAAVYEVAVPSDGTYQLCCRWLAPAAGQSFTASIDDGPATRQSAPGGPGYHACPLGTTWPLAAGKHRVNIAWPGPGSRLDFLELTPR
jgi:hypothetical protein